jgi:hypothetical protein
MCTSSSIRNDEKELDKTTIKIKLLKKKWEVLAITAPSRNYRLGS